MAQTQGDYGSSMTKNSKGKGKGFGGGGSFSAVPGFGGGGRFGGGSSSSSKPKSSGSSKSSAAPARPSGGGGGNRGGGYSGGGGVNYGGGGGGGVGSNRYGNISNFAPTPPPAPPRPPSLEAFSAKDSTYQSQLSALKKALADYMAQQGQSKTQYLTGYTSDRDTLGKNRTQGLSDLENDYASRGLLQSGLYADSMSDLNTDFDKRQAALDQARAAFLAQQTSDLTNFKSEQQLTQQKALQEAAARRAAQYTL